ncbi:unnamed protein product [Owenia fusiformis]|uniref:Uncharacterized protein n=1 Tax=Owenia fusiformis TaxID=6347 RepID=A0A8S4PE05_OWEFU|nr:unnamed protein product [Owenia fusiformis]
MATEEVLNKFFKKIEQKLEHFSESINITTTQQEELATKVAELQVKDGSYSVAAKATIGQSSSGSPGRDRQAAVVGDIGDSQKIGLLINAAGPKAAQIYETFNDDSGEFYIAGTVGVLNPHDMSDDENTLNNATCTTPDTTSEAIIMPNISGVSLNAQNISNVNSSVNVVRSAGPVSNDHNVCCKLDTGAKANLLSRKDHDSLKYKPKIHKKCVKRFDYNGCKISNTGVCIAQVVLKGKSYNVMFVVVVDKGDSLLPLKS